MGTYPDHKARGILGNTGNPVRIVLQSSKFQSDVASNGEVSKSLEDILRGASQNPSRCWQVLAAPEEC